MRINMELGSSEAINQAVIGGLGHAVLSCSTVRLDAAKVPLVERDVEGFPIHRHWHAVWPKGKQPSVVAKTLPNLQHEFADSLTISLGPKA